LSQPLNLPLQGLTDPPDPTTDWTLVHGYGPQVPQPANGPVFHYSTVLEKAGAAPAGGELIAAISGALLVCPPQFIGADASEEIVIPDDAQPITGPVTLYIHPTMNEARRRDFIDRAAPIEGFNGVMYENVDSASLAAALGGLLAQSTYPPGSADDAAAVQMLLHGNISVPVIGGVTRIGNASTSGASPQARRFGFAALSNCGPTDASFVYDWMRDFVADGQPAVDVYLALAPKTWPVIDPSLSAAAKMALTEASLFSWTVLDSLKSALTPDEWRTVGDNQKRIYRARLFRRMGLVPPDSTQPQFAGLASEPPFEFNDKDFKNLFQLEAVTEFYVNFEDPWLAGATPVLPTAAAYVKVDLVDPRGAAATPATGLNRVLLDGDVDLVDLARVTEGKDTIRLEADTGRANKLYRVTAIDPATRIATLDATPVLTGGTSAWRITLRPVLIVIDALGWRLEGSNAHVADTNSPTVVTLDGLVAPSRINTYFDTIYLPEDTANATRTYRIIAVAGQTVTLDGSPSLTGGTSGTGSRWHIPAGISGKIVDVTNLAHTTQGWDRYEGALFVIQNDVVEDGIPWSSYTSRRHAVANQLSSSIKGNAKYDYASLRTGWVKPQGPAATLGAGTLVHLDGAHDLAAVENGDQLYLDNDTARANKRYNVTSHNARTVTLDARPVLTGGSSPWRLPTGGQPFRNYCFSVRDPGATYDGVRRARYYFRQNVAEDTAPPNVDPDVLGKTGIRLHAGVRTGASNGSAGCVTAYAFSNLRDRLIRLYQQEYAAWHAGQTVTQDAEIQKLVRRELDASKQLWFDTQSTNAPPLKRLTAGHWDDKISGTLWLIRPDERPSTV
jgi:hypothetical protein